MPWNFQGGALASGQALAWEEVPLVASLALVAHDERKSDLVVLIQQHLAIVQRLRLVATGTTGQLLADELSLDIQRMASGPRGGDIQIGAQVVQGLVDAVIFLRDPLTAHPHEPDIQALLKVCDLHNVPVATNVAAGRALLEWIDSQAAPS